MGAEFYRKDIDSNLADLLVLDTCTEHTANLYLKIPGGRGGKFKLPTLTELHQFLFGTAFNEAHNATADVEATTRCFELIRLRQFSKAELQVEDSYFDSFKIINPDPIDIIGLKHVNLKRECQISKRRC